MKNEELSTLRGPQSAAKTRHKSITRPSLTFRSLTFYSECDSNCSCDLCEEMDLAALGLMATAILYGRALSFDRTFLFHRQIFPYFEPDNGVLREGLSNAFFFLQEGDYSVGKDLAEDERFMQVVRMARQRNRTFRWHESSLAVGIGEEGNRFGDDDKRVLAYQELNAEKFSVFYSHICGAPQTQLVEGGQLGFELAKRQFVSKAPVTLGCVCDALLAEDAHREEPPTNSIERLPSTEDAVLDAIALDTSKQSLLDWLRSENCLALTNFGSDLFQSAKKPMCMHIFNLLQPMSSIQSTNDREFQQSLDTYQRSVGVPSSTETRSKDRISVNVRDALSILATW